MRCVRIGSGVGPDLARYVLLGIVAIAVLLVCMSPRPVVAEGRPSSFFDYLFWIFFADEIPEPPPLTPADRAAIAKIELLLHEQNKEQRTGGNYLLLGFLAAARRDEDLATDYLAKAGELLGDSALPATMAGQVRLQAGDFAGSLRQHRRFQEIRRLRELASPFLAANNHMDLAVVYAKFNQKEEARAELAKAREQLKRSSIDTSQAAVAWLQMGKIYANVLGDAQAARRAWGTGREILEQPEPGLEAVVRADIEIQIADTHIAEANYQQADAALRSATKVFKNVPTDILPKFRLSVGDSYARLADLQPQNQEYRELGLEQMKPLMQRVRVDPIDRQIRVSAARVSARLLEGTDPEQAKSLRIEAFREVAKGHEVDQIRY